MAALKYSVYLAPPKPVVSDDMKLHRQSRRGRKHELMRSE